MIEGQKVCKQVRDQRNGAKVLLKNEINPKAFAIPIWTVTIWLMWQQSE